MSIEINILLVEDDPILGRSIKQMLELEGFVVNWAQRFEDAKALVMDRTFQCFILDIGLPDGNGLQLCKEIRDIDSIRPILFLTAQTDEETLLEAFNLGANDFIKKPFSQKELIVRLKALTRNIVGTKETLIYGDLKISILTREFIYKQDKIEFNNTEIQILFYLASNAEKVVTREKLLKYLGKENEVYDRTIDSHMSHIRKQLKDPRFQNIQIKSIYGVGYKLEIA